MITFSNSVVFVGAINIVARFTRFRRIFKEILLTSPWTIIGIDCALAYVVSTHHWFVCTLSTGTCIRETAIKFVRSTFAVLLARVALEAILRAAAFTTSIEILCTINVCTEITLETVGDSATGPISKFVFWTGNILTLLALAERCVMYIKELKRFACKRRRWWERWRTWWGARRRRLWEIPNFYRHHLINDVVTV